MATIPQKDLRNRVAEVLRRVEAGEEVVVTVAGRPSVEMRPAAVRRWVGGSALEEVFASPAPTGLLEDLGPLGGAVLDPFV